MEAKETKSSSVNADGPRIRLPHRTHQAETAPDSNRGSNRETIESVVIAFVLAFLFRTFEAEAFVIPTGSMAPTLMGRHKELTCQECGLLFTVGETEETERREPLTECICPNCQVVNDVRASPAFKGDRILVLKALYDLPDWLPEAIHEPQRWDVVVFKFPEEPQINYIKRLVGLPGEELRIHYGNIYTRRDGDQEFHIARKSAEKQKVMRMLVYDNNHPSRTWRRNGWPSRWQSDPGEPWKEFDDGKSFESPAGLGESTEWARLSYHHLAKMWRSSEPNSSPPREHLISDFYAYNAGLANGFPRDEEPRLRWVGDLSMNLRAEITAPRGKLRLELVEAGDRYFCEFDLAAGTCRLLKLQFGESTEQVLATAPKGITRPGRYSIGFGNTDDRLTVWLDDKLLFGDGCDYDGARLGDRQQPTLADLQPASVAVQGTHMRLSDLVLYRDIYYTHGDRSAGSSYEYDAYPSGSWDDIFSDPSKWEIMSTARISSFGQLGPDDFMMMGDNSPRSKDGRLWTSGAHLWVDQIAAENIPFKPETLEEIRTETLAEISAKPGGQVVLAQEHVVHRQLLIGRAFFVYWPHGVPFGPDWLQFDTPRLGPLGSFRLPFYPNVSRMKMIE
jgi:signal peptidase I